MEEQNNAIGLRLIGDLHGHHRKHLEFIEGVEYTLQVGDLGFNYDYLHYHQIDPTKHRFIGGNHDNYDVIEACPNNLGNFGVWSVPNFGDVFYVRGAWSIDGKDRLERGLLGRGFWYNEEISHAEGDQAFELYQSVKPKMLVSHECPLGVLSYVTNPKVAEWFGYSDTLIKTKTNQLLQKMTEFHAPKVHVFGHYHRHEDFRLDCVTDTLYPENSNDGTRYICIKDNFCLDMPPNFVNDL